MDNNCNCEDIEIITFLDEDGVVYVSHGICKRCFRGIILPQIPYSELE